MIPLLASKPYTLLHGISIRLGTQRRHLEILIDPHKQQSSQSSNNKQQQKSNRSSYLFVDRTRLRVRGGRGGKGSLSSQTLRQKHKLRPDGGHGGNGGSVFVVADPNEQSLRWSHPHVQAMDGTNGGSQEMQGRTGKNMILRVPCGVVIKRVLDYNEVWDEDERRVIRIDDDDEEDEEDVDDERVVIDSDDFMDSPADRGERQTVVLADLNEPGSNVLVARGGRGGIGSCLYASLHGPKPDDRQLIQNAQPKPGEEAFLELELKLIADLGLVGFPNAGKSSLLRAMSRATPEVAPYPFTTLHPLLGVIEYKDGYRVRAADIPGLVAGASEGKGKGHDFLRHIERTKSLLYMVDAAGTDYRDPVNDLAVLADELSSYGDGSLMDRRVIVVANKVDLLASDDVPALLRQLHDVAKDVGIRLHGDVVFPISAGVTGEGLTELSRTIRQVIEEADDDRDNAFEAIN
jgi:GTP-binding protein